MKLATELGRIVDLDRYPIADQAEAGNELVRRCRAALAGSAVCCLPGFLRAEALEEMRAEAAAAQPHARWTERERSAYSWLDPDAFPEGHAVRENDSHRIGTISRDRLAESGALLRLFRSDVLTEFLRRCLGFESLYRVECPYLSVNVKVMDEGARLGWHFDMNDGAVSLLLQSAREGGEYEYVPYLRGETDENFSGVASVIKGEAPSRVRRAPLAPGTLCLFMGARSLHRVTPVRSGAPDRLIALFCYDREPGVRFSERTVEMVLGSVPGKDEAGPSPG